MKLKFTNNRIWWDDKHLDLPLRLLDAVHLGERIIVVHNYMDYPRGAPAPNLVAYSLIGEKLWTGENLSVSDETDAYVGFQSEEPLWVYNFSGFLCRIDPENGRLLEKRFTK